jgi:branched-chain amino acid transport system substrate-binding protein
MVVLLATGIAAYASSGASHSPTTNGARTAAAAAPFVKYSALKYCPQISQKQTLTLGGNIELSGSVSGSGLPAAAGLQLGISQINAAGGVLVGKTCYTLALTLLDNRSDIPTAAADATQLATDDGLHYIFGPVGGGTALETGPITELEPGGAIEFSAAADWESRAWLGSAKYPGLFRVSQADPLDVVQELEGLKKADPKVKKVYILFENDAGGLWVNGLLFKAATRLHLKVVGVSSYTPLATADFTPYLLAAEAAHPDAILMGYQLSDAEEVAQQASNLGIKIPIAFQGSTVAVPLTGSDGKPISFPWLANYQQPDFTAPILPATKLFIKQYVAAGNTLATNSYRALYFYDPLYMLMFALERAGSVTNVPAVIKQLGNVRINGAQGDFCFSKHDAWATGTEGWVVNGKITWLSYPPPEADCGG